MSFLSLRYTTVMVVDFLKQNWEGAIHISFHVFFTLWQSQCTLALPFTPLWNNVCKISVYMKIEMAHLFVRICNMKSSNSSSRSRVEMRLDDWPDRSTNDPKCIHFMHIMLGTHYKWQAIEHSSQFQCLMDQILEVCNPSSIFVNSATRFISKITMRAFSIPQTCHLYSNNFTFVFSFISAYITI
jgi:hypothetical protein